MARDYKAIIQEVYQRIMKGESLTEISNDIGVDRKTLRTKMREFLNEDQNKQMDDILKVGRKVNPNSKTKTYRGKKENKDLSSELKILADSGITPEQIEEIFEKMNLNKVTKFTRETFIYKLLEILELVQKRNNEIDPESKGFISIKDMVDMILKNPRMMSRDSNTKLSHLFKVFDDEANLSKESTNKFIKIYPGVLNIGIDKLKQEMIILRQFRIRENAHYNIDTNLLQYCLEKGGNIFKVNSQKIFHRLCYFAGQNHGTTISPVQYRNLQRKEFKQGLNNSTDETLENKYVLPNQDDEFEANVKKIINGAIRQMQM